MDLEVAGDDVDYYMLPDQAMGAKITKFHEFCLQVPDRMCNYCGITLYPEEVCWVGLDVPDGGQPEECRAPAANSHVPGIQGYVERSKRSCDDFNQWAFCKRHSTANGRNEWVLYCVVCCVV